MRYGKAYVGGTMDGKLSLHHPETGKRLTQIAKAVDCQLLKLLRWRTRLAPVAPLQKKRLFPPRPEGTGHLQAQVR